MHTHREKDEQNWQPGDTAEAIVDIIDYRVLRVAFPKGARFVVAEVTIAYCSGCRTNVPAIRCVGWEPRAWADAAMFRKIIPTFEEPKVVDMVTL